MRSTNEETEVLKTVSADSSPRFCRSLLPIHAFILRQLEHRDMNAKLKLICRNRVQCCLLPCIHRNVVQSLELVHACLLESQSVSKVFFKCILNRDMPLSAYAMRFVLSTCNLRVFTLDVAVLEH